MYIQTIPKRTLSEPGLTSPVLVLTLTKTQKRPQKLWTGGANPSSPSFFRLISNTFRWLLECTSLKKVGLQAGRYSGNNRPDLNRTPQALHRVFAPSGPARHCGVFWTRQWLHRRGCCVPPPPPATGFFLIRFFTGSTAGPKTESAV